MRNDALVAVALVGALLLLAGCEKVDSDPRPPSTGTGGTSTGTRPSGGSAGTVGEAVSVALELDRSNPRPKDGLGLTVTVKNGLISDIKEVTAKVLSNPVNIAVTDRDMWKPVAEVLAGGKDRYAKWRMSVKDRASFVPDNNPEELTVRAKYKASVRAAAKFRIGNTAEAGAREKVTTTSSIVPITIEVDPKEVALDKDAEVSITVTVLKAADEASGVLMDAIDSLAIQVPGIEDFDTSRLKCEYEDKAATKKCSPSGDTVTLTGVGFSNNELKVSLVLPMKESSLNNIRGTERSVVVSVADIWLYKDATLSVQYDLSD